MPPPSEATLGLRAPEAFRPIDTVGTPQTGLSARPEQQSQPALQPEPDAVSVKARVKALRLAAAASSGETRRSFLQQAAALEAPPAEPVAMSLSAARAGF